MATSIDLRVDGLASVVRALQAIGVEVEVEDLKTAFDDIADEGERLVAAAAPRRTGRLAGNTRGRRSKSKAVIENALPYAGPINWGWARHNIAPTGYLQRADAQLQPYALRRLEDEINHTIRLKGLK